MSETGRVKMPEEADPLLAPVTYEIGGQVALVKIDHAVATHEHLIVSGWSSNTDLSVSLTTEDGPLQTKSVRVVRLDVASGLQLPGASLLGFVAIAKMNADAAPAITFGDGESQFRFLLQTEDSLSDLAKLSCSPGVFEAVQDHRPGSVPWRTLLSLLPQRKDSDLIVEGIIDVAYASPVQPNGFVTGWVTHKPNSIVWLEDDRDWIHDIGLGYRWVRKDVRAQVHNVPGPGQKSGFHMRARFHSSARSVRICAANVDGVQKLASRPLLPLPGSAKDALSKLLGSVTPRYDLPNRIRQVDLPVLAAVRSSERKVWSQTDVRTTIVGTIPDAPQISIIVPIYGRMDLIENQLLEFDRDSDFKDVVEVVYVLDDPELESTMHFDCHRIQDLCGPGFTWVTTGENRGFSGANNLGAKAARGEFLLFINSDVIPLYPGWATKLAKSLAGEESIGLLAPRLLFADGSIQHAGMSTRWRPEWGLYTNHHPFMGLDTSFDPSKTLRRTPLVTGACMILARDLFDHVGGWDERFITGDFEDSDLCFRVLEAGFDVAYDPSVELTHLERQSFDLALDDPHERERTTLVNACLYNQKWHNQIRDLG